MTKDPTLKLEYTAHPGGWSSRNGEPLPYRVQQITNSIQYNPGDCMSLKQVQDLVEQGLYHITVVLEKFR